VDGNWGVKQSPADPDWDNISVYQTSTNGVGNFTRLMWNAYRKNYGCMYKALDTQTHQRIYENCPAPVTTVRHSVPLAKAAVTVTPNPMRHLVRFDVQDRVPGKMTVKVYDHAGNMVHHFIGANGPFDYAQGRRSPLQWCGTDIAGQPVKPGIYFYQVRMADGSVFTGRIIKVE
jgi:hypothetical protein